MFVNDFKSVDLESLSLYFDGVKRDRHDSQLGHNKLGQINQLRSHLLSLPSQDAESLLNSFHQQVEVHLQKASKRKQSQEEQKKQLRAEQELLHQTLSATKDGYKTISLQEVSKI